MKNFFSFFKRVAVKVADFFVLILGKDNATKLGEATLGILKTAIGQIALVAVQDAAALALDPTAKRQAAFSDIKTKALAQGIQAKDSLINLVLELAVQFIKGNIAASN